VSPVPRPPITRDEVLRTPRAVLAEAIAFGLDLDTAAVEDAIDADLVDGDDFVQAGGPNAGAAGPIGWLHVGDRWEARFAGGRPVLAEAGSVPRGHLPLAERRFGLLVRAMEQINACRLTDRQVAALRADPGNAAAFEAAAEADRRLMESRGGPRAGICRERLLRVRRIVDRFDLVPRGDLREHLDADDESWLCRYLLIYATGRNGVGRHEGRSCDGIETLMEMALAMAVLEARLFGTFDLDGDRDHPLVMVAELRAEGPDGVPHAIERVLSSLATEERRT